MDNQIHSGTVIDYSPSRGYGFANMDGVTVLFHDRQRAALNQSLVICYLSYNANERQPHIGDQIRFGLREGRYGPAASFWMFQEEYEMAVWQTKPPVYRVVEKSSTTGDNELTSEIYRGSDFTEAVFRACQRRWYYTKPTNNTHQIDLPGGVHLEGWWERLEWGGSWVTVPNPFSPSATDKLINHASELVLAS